MEIGPTKPYRIGWWTHRWWPTRPLLAGLLTGNQPSRRADNDSRFVGRRKFIAPIVSRARKLRRPHRPWQAESDLCRFARRGFTPAAAQRKIQADEAHMQRYAQPSAYQLYRAIRARRWDRERMAMKG